MGNFYLQRTLPQGCSISCKYYEMFATFLEWRTKKESKLKSTSHYLDDHFMCGRKGSGECSLLVQTFKNICSRLNVPLCPEKEVLPCTFMDFLGITIDTVNQRILIPLDKIQNAVQKLMPFVKTVKVTDHSGKTCISWQHKKITRSKCESVFGLLEFITRAIIFARPFIQNIRDLMYTVEKQHFKVRITNQVRSDAQVWLDFLQHHNGVTYFLESGWRTLNLDFCQCPDRVHINFQGEVLMGKWPAEMNKYFDNIVSREIMHILLAVALFGDSWKNHRLYFPCFNQDTALAVCQLKHKDFLVMNAIRQLVLQALKHNIFVRARVVKPAMHFTCFLQTEASNKNCKVTLIHQDLWDKLVGRLCCS